MTFCRQEKGFTCYINNTIVSFDEFIFHLDMNHNSKYVLFRRFCKYDDEDSLGYIDVRNSRYYVYYYITFINTLKMTYTNPNIFNCIIEKSEDSYRLVNIYHRINMIENKTVIIIYNNIIDSLHECSSNYIEYHLKPEYEKEVKTYIESQFKQTKFLH